MTVSPTRRVHASAVLGLAVLGSITAALFVAGGAEAKPPATGPTTVRLGITGMVTPSSPHGTWSLSARPGQTLAFMAGFVPGLDTLDVKTVLSVQVSMDAEHLPGGTHAKPLKTNAAYKLTMHKAGRYPLQWTVAFVLEHGHKSTVEATRQFNATVLVAGSSSGSPGLSPGSARSTRVQSAQPTPASGRAVTTPHQSTTAPAPAIAPSSAAVAPTFTLPPDTPTSHRPPGAIAPLPLTTATDTYLFTAIVGTFVIGFLWLLWVASIKPILGR